MPQTIIKKLAGPEDGVCIDRYNDRIDVDLWYPPYNDEPSSPEKIKYVHLGLLAVRAADDIRIHFDFTRNGWLIEQATVSAWSIDDLVCDPKWEEVGFVEACNEKAEAQNYAFLNGAKS